MSGAYFFFFYRVTLSVPNGRLSYFSDAGETGSAVKQATVV